MLKGNVINKNLLFSTCCYVAHIVKLVKETSYSKFPLNADIICKLVGGKMHRMRQSDSKYRLPSEVTKNQTDIGLLML